MSNKPHIESISDTSLNVLVIDLARRSFERKTFSELHPYVGGIGTGAKLFSIYKTYDPLIFSIGPLNGFFPYASKTSIVLQHNNILEDLYLGGALSFKLQFLGVNSVVFLGQSVHPLAIEITQEDVKFYPASIDLNSLGLPGKSSYLNLGRQGVTLDNYFTAPEGYLEKKFSEKNLRSLVFTGNKVYTITRPEKYYELYKTLLDKAPEVTVTPSLNPSCSGCPLGCADSRVGEIGGALLTHTLVACNFARNIYSDIGTVFSCLDVLGYRYTHEELENVSYKISTLIRELNTSLQK
ncbi:MAG: aldehyde ferredoxin oxidoreductase N-terminal domain-containing protein [Patescibacteria group bacterium]|uniref:Aldehyde ferredoxin oxidoreductase N-terminal domain-containing protein n=1 Tax=candidate division WWE3 bacterium TaxID=2053526 RepID=A0A955J209_UNCKA|nr:hypothetical protein [candidate division WWE3 bacterium]